MDISPDLPESILKFHSSLKPYVKERQDALRIRHVLAAHLNSHLNAGEATIVPTNLCLVEPDGGETSFPCIQHDYIRCLQAHFEARSEFAKISTQHEVKDVLKDSQISNDTATVTEACLTEFLDREKQRRRRERLVTIRNFIGHLTQKPAAAGDFFDLRRLELPTNVGFLPQVPTDVIVLSDVNHESEKVSLKALVDRLEKSVLKAKLLLKKEQKLLAKVRTSMSEASCQPEEISRRQALTTTRNELINWIETELAKAGDSSAASEEQNINSTDDQGSEEVESQLGSTKALYELYLGARKRLLIAATNEIPAAVPADIEFEDSAINMTNEDPTTSSHPAVTPAYPYLEDLVFMSSELRSIMEQRSYLTSSLARQLKDAAQDMNRLADESHLLPSYPYLGALQHSRLVDAVSFEEEISSHDKPSSSNRARAWVFAAESSSIATKEAVLENLEEGEVALGVAHQTLEDFRALLGHDIQEDRVSGLQVPKSSIAEDLWSLLDGNLGVIRTEELGTD